MKAFKKTAVIAASLMAAAVRASAQGTTFRGFTSMANSANQTLTDSFIPIINLASILIGVVGAVMLIWNYIKRNKDKGGSDDSLVSWGFGLLFAMLGLQVIKFLIVGL